MDKPAKEMPAQRPAAAAEPAAKEQGDREAPCAPVSIDTDFCGWLDEQAVALRDRRASGLDWDNLAEELEATARKERTSLRSHLQNLLSHPPQRGRAPKEAPRT